MTGAATLCFLLLMNPMMIGATTNDDDHAIHHLRVAKTQEDRALRLRRVRENAAKWFHQGEGGEDLVDRTTFSVLGTAPPVFAKGGTRNTIAAQQEQVWKDILAHYPSAKLIASLSKLVNALYIRISDVDDYEYFSLDDIEGIRMLQPSVRYALNDLNITAEHIQVDASREEFCATGRGVKVAVLDTGVDYTHAQMGGAGTIEAFESAYGTRTDSPRNKQRDGLFPTPRVYDGFDFLGEDEDYIDDNDPIDYIAGHGTFVASNILGMAPDVEIMAIKVCETQLINSGGCPEFAILAGLEFAVDPDDNDQLDDAVDIINLSLGNPAVSAFYSPLSEAAELAFERGILVVASAGNAGNQPFIAGSVMQSTNVLAVGATGLANGLMEYYSSRGPGEVGNMKPDISAPGRSDAASAGSGDQYVTAVGTSFSSPVVAGAAALVKEKCPICSPFAIKAILMNNVDRFVRSVDNTTRAPLTLMGSGEIRVRDALAADFWAFTPDKNDVQPAISLGIINAAENIEITRTLRIHSLTDQIQTLDLSAEFIDPDKASSRALSVSFNSTTILLGGCSAGGFTEITIRFFVDALKVPPNKLSSSNRDSDGLDKNEFGGHIILVSQETEKSISVPFHSVLRQASNVLQSITTFSPPSAAEYSFKVNLNNIGRGTAQVDAYQLLSLSSDDAEGGLGSDDAPADIRAFGYRSYAVNEPECTNMLEFVVTYWEDIRKTAAESILVFIEFRGRETQLIAQPSDYVTSETVIFQDNEKQCNGFPVDHGVSSRNVVIRACNEQLGMREQESFRAAAVTYSPSGFGDDTPFTSANLPQTVFTALPINIPAMTDIDLTVKYRSTGGLRNELGVMLVTNAYRSEENTGAAMRGRETLFVVRAGVFVPQERAIDELDLPDADVFDGPICRWQDDFCTSIQPTAAPVPQALPLLTDYPTVDSPSTDPPEPTFPPTPFPSCPPVNVPRLDVKEAPSPPVSGGVCFSGNTLVDVQGKGAIPMRKLAVGDFVKVANNKYESVYSFGHFDLEGTGDFLSFKTLQMDLLVSRDHMLLTEGDRFVAAKTIMAGDSLIDAATGSTLKVLETSISQSKGVFAPFTPSGTIVVNGVIASSYVAFQDVDYGFADIPLISQHSLAHVMVFPRRLFCNCAQCSSETYDDSGIATWVKTPLLLGRFFVEQGRAVHSCLLIFVVMPIALLFSVLEHQMMNPSCALLVGVMAWGCVLLRRRRIASKN